MCALSYNFTLPQGKINNSGYCSLSTYYIQVLSFHLPDTVSSDFTDSTTLETLNDVHMVLQQPGFHPRTSEPLYMATTLCFLIWIILKIARESAEHLDFQIPV